MISIIVPVYNAESTLWKCITSVKNQTYGQWELLLVDDGSTDHSKDICQFNTTDTRVKYFYQDNGGTSKARNKGLKEATGDYVLFLDADDTLDPDALKSLITGIEADMAIGDFVISGREPRWLMKEDTLLTRGGIIAYLIDYLVRPSGYGLFVYVWGKLFKMSIIRNYNMHFNEGLKIFEGALFTMDYLARSSTACYVRKHIYNYTVNGGITAERSIYTDPLRFMTATSAIGLFLRAAGIDPIMYVNNANVSFAIRQMIRYYTLCKTDEQEIYKLIDKIIHDKDIQRGLKYYQHQDGDSRVIPLMMKLKWTRGVMWACRKRAK